MFNVQNLLTPSTKTVSAAVYMAIDVSPSEIKCDKEQTLKQSVIIFIEIQYLVIYVHLSVTDY